MAATPGPAPVAPYPGMRNALAPYVPRLLDEPWEGARVAAGSVVFCVLNRLTPIGESGDTAAINDVLGTLIGATEANDGDVLSFGAGSLCAVFTGEGRNGRAINAVHAMHEEMSDAPFTMSAGIASGLVHLVTAGENPRQLMAVGPPVSRAIELAGSAGPGATRTERVDHSNMETQGRPTEWPPSDFVAASVAPAIGRTDPELLPAAVGIAVYSGVDQALRRNPGRAIQQLQAVVDTVQRAAGEFGITVLSNDVGPGGGFFLLTAGIPAETNDGEERMIQAAKAALEGEPPLALRFGIATGPVLAGSLGGQSRRTYTAAGLTVDLAIRLAASATPGEVLTTHRTIDRAYTRYAVREWEPVVFAGIDGTVVPVAVGAELATGGAASEGGFVGRSEEQSLLVQQLQGLENGRGGVVEIAGGAGIGKSRLVNEALRHADMTVVVVRGEERGHAQPYGAASRLLRAAMGIDEHEDPKRVGILLKATVRDLTPYLDPWLPLLAEVIGAEVPSTPTVEELAPAYRRHRTHWAVSQLAGWLTREPVIVVIEDAHWLDAASAELLDYVAREEADLPWLIISTRRGNGIAAPDVFRIDLQPLAPGASRALMTELSREDPIDPDLLPELVERSGGIPMLVEYLATNGHGKRLPGNVEAAARAKIDRLDEPDREASSVAAIFGGRIDPAVAEQITGPVDWARLDTVLERADDGGYRFRHGSVRDAAYEATPAKTRRRLHDAVAAALTDPSGAPEVLAAHFHRAGNHKKTWGVATVAGKRAVALDAPVEASILLDWALVAGRKLDAIKSKQIAEIAELLGDASGRAGRYREADKAYVVAAESVATKVDQARLARKRAMLRHSQGQDPAALRMLTSALRALPKQSGPGEKGKLELAYATVRFEQGRFVEAIERSDRAIELAEHGDDRATLAEALLLRGRARSYLEPASGEEDLTRALKTAEEISDHLLQAGALHHLGLEAYRHGRWDDAREYQRRSSDERDLAGDVIGAAFAGHGTALVLLDQGRLVEAEAEFERVGNIFRTTGDPAGLASTSAGLATLAARRGETSSALAALEKAIAEFEELGHDASVATARLAEAEAHLLGGDVEAALASADKAIEAFDSPGSASPMVGLQRVRGVALVWMGRSQEGHVQLMDALNAAQTMEIPYEEALVSDALATLYGETDVAERRDAIIEQLGIVKLPPFLTVS